MSKKLITLFVNLNQFENLKKKKVELKFFEMNWIQCPNEGTTIEMTKTSAKKWPVLLIIRLK